MIERQLGPPQGRRFAEESPGRHATPGRQRFIHLSLTGGADALQVGDLAIVAPEPRHPGEPRPRGVGLARVDLAASQFQLGAIQPGTQGPGRRSGQGGERNAPQSRDAAGSSTAEPSKTSSRARCLAQYRRGKTQRHGWPARSRRARHQSDRRAHERTTAFGSKSEAGCAGRPAARRCHRPGSPSPSRAQ